MKGSMLVYHALNIGEEMLLCGAEIGRVEDTIARICRSYDVIRVDVFTITSTISVTAVTRDEGPVTQTRRIMGQSSDMEKLDRLNNLSRYICQHRPESDEIERLLREACAQPRYCRCVGYLIYALTTSAFTCFFGGGLLDALCAALIGCAIKAMIDLNEHMRLNRLFFTILCSAASGALALALMRLGLGRSLDKIVIGDIMVLIPGLAFTNSIRDLISGDIMSGVLRIVESLLIAVCIALGFGLALGIWGGVL